MSDERLTPRRLADIESAAQEALHGNLLEQTWAGRRWSWSARYDR
jgi:hypothetical protein